MAGPNYALPVKIGERSYPVDLSGFLRRPLASIRQMQDIGREPSDASFDNQGIWKRTQSDFILGMGQIALDQEDEADRRRFRTSYGIDSWTRGQLSCLPSIASVGIAYGSGSELGDMVVAGDYLWVASGEEVFTWDGTTIAGRGASGAVQLAVVGGYVYATNRAGTNIFRSPVDTPGFIAWTSPFYADVIGTKGGRLVAGAGASLYEMSKTAQATLIYTHFDSTNFKWQKIVGAPNGIYCFGDDASHSSAWMLTVVDATGSLAPPYPVLELPDGEFIQDVLFFGGVLVFATNLGVRLATIGGSGFLTAGPLIATGNCRCLTTDGSDVWFGYQDERERCGLGRLRPSRFTDTLVPAYNTDIALGVNSNYETIACGIFQGKPAFLAVNHIISAKLFVVPNSSGNLAEGQLWSGRITYGTPELKGVHSIEATWEPLPAGCRVRLDVLDAEGNVLTGGIDDSTTGSTGMRAALNSTYSGESVEVRITLTPNGADSPVLLRWTLRAIPLPYRTEEVILPLMLGRSTSQEYYAQQVIVEQDPVEEFNYLHGLMQSRAIVDVTIGDRTEKMMVDSFGVSPDVQSVGVSSWTPQSDWLEGVWAVRLLTVEPEATL